MFGLSGPLGTLIDLVTVVLGFGFIVFFHELGHFLAARWAGIRVLTFAVGFGPPLVSWRRGVGLRRGSSRDEVERLVREACGGPGEPRESARAALSGKVSQTEYRLSALPFGGYVQMLGQDDLDPGAVSSAADSYQSAPVWKRMVVISAGVVMNVILAGVLFVVVFTAGLRVEPPTIGDVLPGSAAAGAVLVDSAGVPISGGEPGLRPGDEVLTVDGGAVRRWDQISLHVAMADASRPLEIEVRRDGRPLRFHATPRKDERTRLLELGVIPPFSTQLVNPRDESDRDQVRTDLGLLGLAGLEPGDLITAVDGRPVRRYADLESAFAESGGAMLTLSINRGGAPVEVGATPRPELEIAEVTGRHTGAVPLEHLLGLVPVMRVSDYGQPAQGLAPGDVFLRIGSVEFPSFPAGLNEIKGLAGRPVELVVLRPAADGSLEEVLIPAKVKRDGTVGFMPDVTTYDRTLLAMTPAALTGPDDDQPVPTPAAGLVARAGAVITTVAGAPVSDLGGVRDALLAATAEARAAGADGATVEIGLTFPFSATDAAETVVPWRLDRAALDRLGALGWQLPLPLAYVEPERTLLKADGPLDAIRLGVLETHRVMTSVYVTFLRLGQGSLEVQHIKGPVGIAHVGTMIADRGVIWLLFFLGLISVNLAVVNFLPLPIVDGGQFLMLVYEQVRGKPVPIPVQNAVMMAGMLLIVSVFLLVTFNDIRALLGG